jgi:hypothetical protein
MPGEQLKTETRDTMENTSGPQIMESRSPVVRLLLIPFLVYCAWVLESFLLEGNSHLFMNPEPLGLVVYTLVGCVLTGMIIPVVCIHKAFVTGAVNMYQIGFRSLRRTVLACSVTGALGYAVVVGMNPFGADKLAFAYAFMLLLPTAIASVMICWVLIGTHVQAFVRGGGALISISVGVVVTSLLFGMTSLAHGTFLQGQDTLFWSVCTGLMVSLFFFAVRDIYATIIVVAESTVFTAASSVSPLILDNPTPALFFSAILAGGALFGIHWYLSRNYATVVVPGKN